MYTVWRFVFVPCFVLKCTVVGTIVAQLKLIEIVSPHVEINMTEDSTASTVPPGGEDRALLMRELWTGAVPAVIALAEKEIASTSSPDQIYVRRAFIELSSSLNINH